MQTQRPIDHCPVSTGRLVRKGRPGTLETKEVFTAYQKEGGGLRAHTELLKWGNIP